MDLEKAVREGNVYNPDFVTPSKGEEIVADMTLQDSKERKYLIQAENGNSTARTKAEQARAKWRRDALDLLAIAGNDRIPCPHGCSGRGQCVHGLCQCENKWSGPYCSVESTPKCEKTCLATCQKNSAEGDDGADARQRCLKDCIKKNCHAQKFNIRRVPPMESMVDRIYAQQQMNRVEGRQSLPIRPGTHNHGGEANGVPPKL